MSWINSARTIVENKTAQRIDIRTGHLVPDGRRRRGNVILLDGFSASVMVQVYDALSPEGQKKFNDMNIIRAHSVAFKLAKRW